jgi:hypothetical protein
MKRYFGNTLLATAAVASMTLGGCNWGGVSVDDIIAKVDSAQKVALKLCQFLPYADVVRKIFAANDTNLQTAEQVGKSICAAMTPVKTNKAAAANPPKVGGVPVEGEFVTPEGQ